MPRNGLSKERVVKAAAAMIEQSGSADFSMRALADSLGIKTASLYNHVESMDALMIDVCTYALHMQRDTELQAIDQKIRTDGIFALANAYRSFAREHRELYRLIIHTAASSYDKLTEPSLCAISPFLQILDGYTLTQEQKYHWQHILRGVIHGFVSQEDAGFFSHLPVDVEISFRMAMEAYIVGLEQTEKGNHHAN